MSIRIVNIYRVKPGGKFLCYFTVALPGGIIIWDCKLMKGVTDSRYYSTMPTKAYEQNGVKKWMPIVEITDDSLREAITEAARDAFLG